MADTVKANAMLDAWKGDSYAYGRGVLGKTGAYAAGFGSKALVVASIASEWARPVNDEVTASLDAAGVTWTAILGSRPNSPREDVYRIANEISKFSPDVIVSVGGGSTIDAVKCSNALAVFTHDETARHLGASSADASTMEPYFGAGQVTAIAAAAGKRLIPTVAVQTLASSAAHLTKYSNVTDPLTGQKKLIIDDAIVPERAVFDYGATDGVSRETTLDGGLDGLSHLWEVFMGASGKPFYQTVKEIAVAGIDLIVGNLPRAVDSPGDTGARDALGYGTDLGGYAIMVGGTNGGHLGSFSLVDVLTHGRACAVLNPYYTVLFADAIQDQLRAAADIFSRNGYIDGDIGSLGGRALAEAVARGMLAFSKAIGFPQTLGEAGATERHIERMIGAAKNPQLASKLMNMPTPMDAARGDVDTYMRPVLEAAFTGDFSRIRTMTGE